MCSYFTWENMLNFPPIFFGEEAADAGGIAVGCLIAGDAILLDFTC